MVINKLMSISQAAKYLGVSMKTLHRWDKSGKLKAIRNSINNHRMFRKEDLDKVYNLNVEENKTGVL